MKTVKAFIILFAFGMFSSIAIGGTAVLGDPLEQWEHNHPDASKALGEWAKANKKAAKYLFDWDGDHPDRSQALVAWAIDHPKEELSKFHKEHKDWPELDEFEKSHKKAMEGFLKWCSDYAEGARALMEHSGGLKWAGDHLWKEANRMEKN
ncbi:MAG: hypothetical protein ACLQQ4_13905 [Bacteroidia bacterium]